MDRPERPLMPHEIPPRTRNNTPNSQLPSPRRRVEIFRDDVEPSIRLEPPAPRPGVLATSTRDRTEALRRESPLYASSPASRPTPVASPGGANLILGEIILPPPDPNTRRFGSVSFYYDENKPLGPLDFPPRKVHAPKELPAYVISALYESLIASGDKWIDVQLNKNGWIAAPDELQCGLCHNDDTVPEYKKQMKHSGKAALEAHMKSMYHSIEDHWLRYQQAAHKKHGRWMCSWCMEQHRSVKALYDHIAELDCEIYTHFEPEDLVCHRKPIR